ncbi:hypothetical protein KP79_PYT10768 [Mizuhopecten yessoensis]|uniref:Uncharacterized protein n=1 Tax=Mizuhopecten yessoensis TaxID=6573 RepID=A0A210PGV6_MIZYE|nr:hypothetical protein KP79_PYT10768 [Mizuhopecten yessoensis]
MGASVTKHKQKKNHVTCTRRRSPSTSSDYSSDSGDSSDSSVDSDGSTNQSHEERTSTPCAADESTFSGKDPGEYKYNSKQDYNQKDRPKESIFVETSEFPYARAKLVHPQTSREHQEARSEGRRKEGISSGQQTWSPKPSLLPRPKQQENHVMFAGPSQSRAERTINPHILWNLHSNGSGINVVPCTEVSRRNSDHMPVGTWRNPNRVHTYFREQTARSTNEPVPTNDDVCHRCARAVRPPTPCVNVPVNTAMWSSAANSGAVLGYSGEERKALIRAQYKVELDAIRQMTNQYSRMSSTGHR